MASPSAGLNPPGARTSSRHSTCKTGVREAPSPVLRKGYAWHILCCIVASCLFVAAAAEEPSTTAAVSSADMPQGPSDFYSNLVTISSNVHGEVKKAGPLPAERYDDNLFNHSMFRDWLLRKDVYREDVPEPAPMSYKCGVFVNHHYKLIFIRNRKAASTTVLDTFKAACKSQSSMCMRPFSADEMKQQGLSHDDMWRSYYVISSTRNPWARAASGYEYTQERWPVKAGICGPVLFREFCADPYMMGKMSNLFRCGAQGSFRGDDSWAYDFYHIEPAYHCMTDATGSGLSVDFLIRYEYLQEDFANLIDIINNRRDSNLPEFRGGRMRWRKQGTYVQAARNRTSGATWREEATDIVSSDRHAVRYRDCGMDCVRDIATFFSKDMQLMEIEVPDTSSESASVRLRS